MPIRARKKSVRQAKYRRCPKCQKLIRSREKRCRTCHLVLPKL